MKFNGAEAKPWSTSRSQASRQNVNRCLSYEKPGSCVTSGLEEIEDGGQMEEVRMFCRCEPRDLASTCSTARLNLTAGLHCSLHRH